MDLAGFDKKPSPGGYPNPHRTVGRDDQTCFKKARKASMKAS